MQNTEKSQQQHWQLLPENRNALMHLYISNEITIIRAEILS